VSKPKKEEKAKAKMEHQRKEQHGDFFSHLRKARIEVLRAFRTLIDERISSLEKQKKKVTKVKVE
jgi:hypothetical protein